MVNKNKTEPQNNKIKDSSSLYLGRKFVQDTYPNLSPAEINMKTWGQNGVLVSGGPTFSSSPTQYVFLFPFLASLIQGTKGSQFSQNHLDKNRVEGCRLALRPSLDQRPYGSVGHLDIPKGPQVNGSYMGPWHEPGRWVGGGHKKKAKGQPMAAWAMH